MKNFEYKKSPPLERDIEKSFLRNLKKTWPTSKTRKMNGYGNRSWPDRLILLPATPLLLIEFKRPGEDLSKGQEQLHKELKLLGVRVYTCDDAEQAMNICFSEFQNAKRKKI